MSIKKDIKLNFRVDSSFYDMFQDKLQQSGLAQSDFIREAILYSTVKQRRCEGIEDLIYEINKIGVNINQISKHLNDSKLLDEAVMEELHLINNHLAELIKEYT